MKASDIRAPEKLTAEHDFSNFNCGEITLNDWLRRHAVKNELNGASRTYVITLEQKVVGYYCLAVGAVSHEGSPGPIKRNMPNPIPVMILGRLAVDSKFQGYGIGTGLLKDAILRTLSAADIAGIRALLVHAISKEATHFYSRFGFIASPVELTLMITIAEARGSSKANTVQNVV